MFWLWVIRLLCALLVVKLATTFGAVVVWLRKYIQIRSAVQKLPGIDEHWLWGHLQYASNVNEETMLWAEQLVDKYPMVFKIFFGSLKPFVVCVHPETAKLVLSKAEPKPLTFGSSYAPFRPWLGNGLFLSKGKLWSRNRKLLTPAFHFEILKSYEGIYNRAASTLIDKFKKEIAKGGSVEIYKPLCLCAFDVILSCAFTHKKNVQQENDTYGDAIANVAKICLERTFAPWLQLNILFYNTARGRQFKHYLKITHDFAHDLIKNRIKERNWKNEEKVQRDFLDILLLAKDEQGNGLTVEEIREEIDTFLNAGHGTSSSAMAWVLLSLAKHPEIQARCREEVQGILGDSTTVSIDSLNKLTYLTQCIKEGLRLHTPVPMIARELTKPVFMDGHLIPAGAEVVVAIYLLHHNPTVWGDDHNEFKPERFSAENVKSMDPYAFIPFAAGPRNCIGQNLAMHEMKVVVARILNEFEISVDKSHSIEREADMIMKPVHGIKLFLKRI